jgi:hypothetical protein
VATEGGNAGRKAAINTSISILSSRANHYANLQSEKRTRFRLAKR